jgi:hypothetical protein
MEGIGSRARHYAIAMNHPPDAVSNLLMDKAKVVYLSFPISAPRGLESGNEEQKEAGKSLKEAIDRFHQTALTWARGAPDRVVVSPLAIDELPFSDSVPVAKVAIDHSFAYDPNGSRWSLGDLWGRGAELMSSPVTTRYPFLTRQAQTVLGSLAADVAWRDTRLVLQASCVACFCPVVPRVDGIWRVSRGVNVELDRAQRNEIMCYVYQDEKMDPTGVWNNLHGPDGSMGTGGDRVWKHTVKSLDELFDRIARERR